MVGDLIKDEKDYVELQAKARKVKFSVVLCDVNQMDSLGSLYRPDVLYLSNIGYRPQGTVGLAYQYSEQGVQEVFFAIGSNEEEFQYHERHESISEFREKYDSKSFYYEGKKLSEGDKISYDLYHGSPEKRVSLTLEVVSADKNADYGLTLKLAKSKLR